MNHDDDGASFGAQLILLALGLFVVSGFVSLNELIYAIWGKTVAAQVREAKLVTVTEGRGRQTEKLSVAYSFTTDDGQAESASELLPNDWPTPGATISVQHVAGQRVRSRVVGNGNTWAVYVFLASLAVMAGAIGKFYLEAKASERRPRRRYH